MDKLNKRQKQLLLILIILAVIFSAVVFLIPFPKGGTFFIAYFSELIALAAQIPIFKLAFDNAEELRSKVLGFPVFRVGYLYLGVQTIATLLLFVLGCLPGFPVWLSAVICLLILGASGICSITADISRTEVESIEVAAKRDTSFMLSLRTRSENLIHRTEDADLKKKLEKLAEKFRYSDPVSSPEISETEDLLSKAFSRLEAAVNGNDTTLAESLCREVSIALDDRNTACKNNKH